MDPESERAWSREIEKRMGEVTAERVELIDADEVHRWLRAERARYHPAARDELRGAIDYDEAERPGRGADLENAALQISLRQGELLAASLQDVDLVAGPCRRPWIW